jgi:iron complex outermembrane recepter protein
MRGQTVSDERAVGASIDVGAKSFALHLDGHARRQDDYRIPGYAILDDPDSPSGRLPNSFVDQRGGNAGASWIGDRGYVGVSASLIDAQYGIPTEELAFIGLHQKRFGIAAELDDPFANAKRLRFRASGTDYQHIEYEADKTPATTFTNRGFEARADATLDPLAGWTPVVGVAGYSHELAAVGEEAVIPRTRGIGAGVFALAERRFGNGIRVDAGLRIDSERRRPDNGLPARSFTPFQASGGVLFDARNGYVAAATIAHAERAPSIEELYSNGPHAATGTFDLGDPYLPKETSTNLDIALRKVSGAVTGSIGAFLNDVRDFVYGAFVDANGDGIPDRVDADGAADPDGEFVVQQFTAARARLYGVEGEIVVRPAREGAWLRLYGDLTRGRLRNGDGNLPRMPAARIGAETGYRWNGMSVGASVVHGFAQNRTATLESSTPSYTRVDVDIAWTVTRDGVAWQLFARGLNLGNEDIRVATSYLKEIAPLPGRSFLAGVRASF